MDASDIEITNSSQLSEESSVVIVDYDLISDAESSVHLIDYTEISRSSSASSVCIINFDDIEDITDEVHVPCPLHSTPTPSEDTPGECLHYLTEP